MLTLRPNQKPTSAVQKLVKECVSIYSAELAEAKANAKRAEYLEECTQTAIFQFERARELSDEERESFRNAKRNIKSLEKNVETTAAWLAKLENLGIERVKEGILARARTTGIRRTLSPHELVRQLACA